METTDFLGKNNKLVKKWSKVLEGIDDTYTRKVTAILLENQAKSVLAEKMRVDEDLTSGATTVGKLGTFQKFAFPLIRRVYPELIANKIVSVQPMQGPVSQVFYLGHNRVSGTTEQTVYSKYNLTYRNFVTSAIGEGQYTSGLDVDVTPNPDLSSLLDSGQGGGSPSSTFGGQIAAWPTATTILGYSVSAGEHLAGTGIPEINFHIEQQPVQARTRKMRALWSIEANQDLRAYHNLDLEKELTQLMSQELELEIDRELLEDIRMLAYDPTNIGLGGFHRDALDNSNSNNFGDIGGVGQDGARFIPAQFLYDFDNQALPTSVSGTQSNVWVIDFTSSALPFAPQHVGHTYSNLLAIVNFAAQDIYKTTHRGPGSWLVTSPHIAAMLESAAKLEGGLRLEDNQTAWKNNKIEYRGKFAGRYDLYVDPLWPEDEILIGYKGNGPMDAGYCFCPYIPLELLPTIPDPETFQPRKGVLTRYGKLAIAPESKFFRVIRIVGPTSNFLFQPFGKATGGMNAGVEGVGNG